jgi:hypothetical protein
MYRMLCLATFGLSATLAAAEKPKILHVDSYHEGFSWSDGVVAGATKILGNKATLRVERMDTKRHGEEAFKVEAGKKVKAVIDEWKPDVVIVADDNAAKYVTAAFYKDSPQNFVFCGLNWDEKVYGFPWPNVTGMLEVTPVMPLLNELKKFSKGERIGFLGIDNETSQKEVANCTKKFTLKFETVLVKDFAAWKAGFLKLQSSCDLVLLDSDGGLFNDTKAEAVKFVRENTLVPTGSCYDFMAPLALINVAKSAQEQGEWAAAQALKIAAGTKPSAIPVAENKRGEMFLNMPLAKKLGVRFPMELLETATVIKE